jgi:hypothetical protein
VVHGTDGSSQVADGLGGELSLPGDAGSEFTSVVLDVLDVRLDLGSEFLQVLDN